MVKVLKSLGLRWYGHMARINNERISQQIVTTRTERIRKRGNPQKRWTDVVKEDRSKIWHTVARDGKECRRISVEAKFNYGL